jgi:AcrR family transcriptional regulator
MGQGGWEQGMARLKATQRRDRGSAQGWLEAAYENLVDGGIEAVRVMPLAKKKRLSRTSFYWFYNDREALLEGMI